MPVPDAAHHGHGERPMDGATDNRQGGGLGRGERPWAREDAKTVGQNRGDGVGVIGAISLASRERRPLGRRGRGDWIVGTCGRGLVAVLFSVAFFL